MSYSINFKGKPDPKNPSLVKIEMIFFKTDYARVPKVINITGLYKYWDQKHQMFIGNTNDSLERNKLFLNLKIKYNKVAAEWE